MNQLRDSFPVISTFYIYPIYPEILEIKVESKPLKNYYCSLDLCYEQF